MKKLPLITTLFLICLQAVAQDFWIPLEPPNPDTEIYCMKSYGEQGLLIGTQFGLYKTLDNGETWILTGYENVAGKIDINYSNGDIFIIKWSELFYSKDSGNTWSSTVFQEAPYTLLPYTMFLSQEKDIFIGCRGGIIKTNYTCTEVEVVFDNYYGSPITSFTQNSEGVLFAGTTNFFKNSDILFSDDGGNTWESCWQEDNHVQSIATNSIDYIFAGTRYGFFRSTDNGNTWERKKLADVQAIVIDPNDRIFIGCTNEYGGPGCVLYSDDHGETWEDITQDLTDLRIEKMALSSNGYLYLVSRSGSVYTFFRTIAPVSTNIHSNIKSEQILVFPNPVKNILIFSTKYPLEGKTTQITIYNITGEKVLEKEIQLTSNNSLDISYLQTGIYAIVIDTKTNRTFYQKIIKH